MRCGSEGGMIGDSPGLWVSGRTLGALETKGFFWLIGSALSGEVARGFGNGDIGYGELD